MDGWMDGSECQRPDDLKAPKCISYKATNRLLSIKQKVRVYLERQPK